ncbi:hypothetical protein [Variovorax sp. GB1P17]|uniref:hypothetical protein n=1 Tax=Variovorax sp. GB1P17 TaxID=3443740 RepID=UPI003F45DA58
MRMKRVREDPGRDEEHGEWLDFRLREGRVRIAARISRKAMEDHFGAKDDGPSLLSIYVINAEVIHQKVRAKMKAGGSCSLETPMELRSLDFLLPSGASLSIPRAPGQMTDDETQNFLAQVARPSRQGASGSGNYVHWKGDIKRVGLTGIFSADQLEAMAAWMRRALKVEP